MKISEFVFNSIINKIPTKYGSAFRVFYIRLFNSNIDSDCFIAENVRILGLDRIIIQKGVAIARNCTLDARGGLTLETYCLIGLDSLLLTSTHNSNNIDIPIIMQGHYKKNIIVSRYSWLGARCVILPGVIIGEYSIIGSGAVLTKSAQPFSIYGGVPAIKIKDRK